MGSIASKQEQGQERKAKRRERARRKAKVHKGRCWRIGDNGTVRDGHESDGNDENTIGVPSMSSSFELR